MSKLKKLRIKKGDFVKIISGSSFGVVGLVQAVNYVNQKIIVQGANLVKKAVKPNPMLGSTGGHVTIEAPIAISNVMFYDSALEKVSRIAFKTTAEGKKLRFAKQLNKFIED
jgi:large subunit ribosomal protein L24